MDDIGSHLVQLSLHGSVWLIIIIIMMMMICFAEVPVILRGVNVQI